MAKLKCNKHKKRIHAFDGLFMHRSNSELCDSPTASIMRETYTPASIQFGMVRPPRSEK